MNALTRQRVRILVGYLGKIVFGIGRALSTIGDLRQDRPVGDFLCESVFDPIVGSVSSSLELRERENMIILKRVLLSHRLRELAASREAGRPLAFAVRKSVV